MRDREAMPRPIPSGISAEGRPVTHSFQALPWGHPRVPDQGRAAEPMHPAKASLPNSPDQRGFHWPNRNRRAEADRHCYRRRLFQGFRRRALDETGASTIEFLPVILSITPGEIIGGVLARTIPPNHGALGAHVLFARRLAKSEIGLPVAESEHHDGLWGLAGDQVVEQRKMKSRWATGIKFRLKTKQTRKFLEHQRSVGSELDL